MNTRTIAAPQTKTKSTTTIKIDRSSVNYWNARYLPLTFAERIDQFYKDFGDKKILLTSSFGTSSVLLLKLISQSRPEQPIHFIDTTYHFPETIDYKNQLAASAI